MTDSPNPQPKTVPAWATRSGLLPVSGPRPVDASAQALADRDYIRESISLYSYGYDERRLDVLEALFTEDVRFAINIAGDEQEVVGRDRVIAWLADIMESQSDQRKHVMSNIVIRDLDGDSASASTYLVVFSTDTESEAATTGFYDIELRKEEGRWRISYILDGLDLPF